MSTLIGLASSSFSFLLLLLLFLSWRTQHGRDRPYETRLWNLIVDNMVLFITGLVPKVFASLTLWAMAEISRMSVSGRVADQTFFQCLLEEAKQCDGELSASSQPQATTGIFHGCEHLDSLACEVMRLHPPVPGGCRGVDQDAGLGGHRIPAGCKVRPVFRCSCDLPVCRCGTALTLPIGIR